MLNKDNKKVKINNIDGKRGGRSKYKRNRNKRKKNKTVKRRK
jgi:hypothetical protein